MMRRQWRQRQSRLKRTLRRHTKRWYRIPISQWKKMKKAIVNKEELKAEAEGVKTEKEEELETTMKNLEQLSNTNADLHKDCDFTIKNFDIRQTARDQEIEALKQAKAILSGSKFSEFLQIR